ncbi:hypothetical protein CBER1_07198 [Cercospora berteroae]|uniref:Uncharacterized protein n=1 Tax=Cercospora berteroae TaxID=357750 RepID=A0A2S6BRW5_9PEZI|nr:hypothetical protein CBER1_07198 [Cercospora berteroae]
MGILLDENGDPKAWASCLLCGLAAMGEDELEAEKDKKKRLEREARWKAERLASAQTNSQLPPAQPTADEETELHTADLIRPIVNNQPHRVHPMAATPADLPTFIITSPTIVETDTRSTTPHPQPHSRSTTPASMVRSSARSTAKTDSTHSRHDSPASTSSTKASQDSLTCPLCDSAAHTEDKCPRLEGIPILPTQGMARSSGRYYAASNKSTTGVVDKR